MNTTPTDETHKESHAVPLRFLAWYRCLDEKYKGSGIYPDLDIPKIESMSDTQPHRIVDHTIATAAEGGNGSR